METYGKVKELLESMEGVIVAFSGGVDSSLLLAIARDALEDRVLAVSGVSPTYPVREMDAAMKIAEEIGVRHVTILTNELENEEFCANPPHRCYLCKKTLFSEISAVAQREHIPFIVDGSNADDAKDFRPGTKAAREFGVRSPFVELGIGKEEIRRLAKHRGLSCWNKPPLACLASRIPYGDVITADRLKRINKAEEAMLRLGFKQVRVRDYGNLARIEIPREEHMRLLDDKVSRRIVEKLKKAGYTYVSLDLDGYRTGSMNEGLPGIVGID